MPNDLADTERHRLERAILAVVVARFESLQRHEGGGRYGLEGVWLSGEYPDTVLNLRFVDRITGDRHEESSEFWASASDGIVQVLERLRATRRELVSAAPQPSYDDEHGVHARSVLAAVIANFQHYDTVSNEVWVLRGAWLEGEYPDTALAFQRFDRHTGREYPRSTKLWAGALAHSADITDVTDSAFFIWVWGSGG